MDKAYSKYKDTNSEWLEKIPEHWEFSRLRFNLEYEKGIKPNLFYEFEDGLFPYLTMEYLRYSIAPESFSSPLQGLKINENEMLLLWDGSNAGEFIISKEGILSSTMAKISVKNTRKFNFSFICYQLKWLERYLKDLTIGMGIPHVNSEILKNFFLVIPSIAEQEIISNYLDKKTSEIDTLISNKENLIELLKEERTAIINKAVTKGINPKAKMKDSEIEWLGEIPEHWEVKKLKYVSKLNSGDFIKSESIMPTGEYPVYGGNGIRGYNENFFLEGNYVLIGRQGALCGNINYASGKFWASEHAVVCYLKKEYNFIWYGELLRSMNLNQYSQAAAQPGLSVEKIANLEIPVPPKSEQEQIANKINETNSGITYSVNLIEKEIELIKEYRTALISEAVTGKIDLRNY